MQQGPDPIHSLERGYNWPTDLTAKRKCLLLQTMGILDRLLL